MALTLVQTAIGSAPFGASVSATFATPPAVGSAVVVVARANPETSTYTAGTDTAGHSYTLAHGQVGGAFAHLRNDIYVCPILTATATPFTVTLTGTSASRDLVILEVAGVGLGLTVHQTAGTFGATYTSTAGPTAAVTAPGDVLMVASVALTGVSGALVVTPGPSPVWTQATEGGTYVFGEVDTRAGTGLTGPAAVTWDNGFATGFVTALVVFAVAAPPTGVPIRGAFVAGEATTVTASRAVAFGLDGASHTHGTSGVLQVYGAGAVTGTVTVGDVSGVTATQLVGRGPSGALEGVTVGTGLTFTGNVLAVPPGTYDAPLSDGDLAAADLIFADGNVIIVQVPT